MGINMKPKWIDMKLSNQSKERQEVPQVKSLCGKC